MRILVTGGAGYIGSHTVLTLLETGNDIDIVDSFCNSFPEVLKRIEYLKNRNNFKSKVCLHCGDIRDDSFLQGVFENALLEKKPIEAVIHFAGLKSVSESINNPEKYWDYNVNGSKNLLKVMEDFECKSIVFSSSATVYKFRGVNDLLSENSQIDPINPYGETKVAVEKILCDIFKNKKGWRISILRYFNPIGAHISGMIGENPIGIPNNLFPIICKVASGEMIKLKIYGEDWLTNDGTAIRDYLHVMDLADAHYFSLNKLMEFKSKLMILNIGTGLGTSVLDLVKTFESVNKCKIPFMFSKKREGDVPYVVADNRLACEILKWYPKRNLKEMCRDGWNWQKKNPNGYQ